MSGTENSDDIQTLIDNNRRWSARVVEDDPEFFARLSKQQKPKFLWIGCSDSRVPANQITGLMPGEVFVHRNVANVVLHTDLNCMSVVDFAIRTLQVRHVIICGHYGCGGVQAALHNDGDSVVNHWLGSIHDVWLEHRHELQDLNPDEQHAALCELNVRRQVRSLCRTTIMRQAWRSGQSVDVHGWIYGIEDGLLRNLGERITSLADLEALEAR